jgi:pimeloyl-ACP methyl ester carboxylesterase
MLDYGNGVLTCRADRRTAGRTPLDGNTSRACLTRHWSTPNRGIRQLLDYATNSPLYPRLHDYFRTSRPPLLAAWGRGDEIFGPAGAQAFAEDLPDADIHLLDGGHFLLESALEEVPGLIRTFLAKSHR